MCILLFNLFYTYAWFLIMYMVHACTQPRALKDLNGQYCEICGDEIGITVAGDLFVACNECGFPVCRPCYEYERREGSQLCPQCKTRYKRLKGTLIPYKFITFTLKYLSLASHR